MKYSLDLVPISILTSGIEQALYKFIADEYPESVIYKQFKNQNDHETRYKFINVIARRVGDLIRVARIIPKGSDQNILVELLKETGIPSGLSLNSKKQQAIIIPLLAEYLILSYRKSDVIENLHNFNIKGALETRNIVGSDANKHYIASLAIGRSLCKAVIPNYKTVNDNSFLIA